MISRRSLLLSGAAAAGACRRKRGAGFNGFAFVANYEGQAVAAVDLTAFAVTRQIRLGASPADLLRHQTKSLVYALTPASGMLYEIDGSRLAVKRQLYLGGPATAMRSEAGGNAIWIISGPGRRLLRIPVDEFKVAASIELPLEPSHFDLSAYTGLAVITDARAGKVLLGELRSARFQKPLQLRGQLGATLFRSDGEAVLVANREARQLTVLNAPEGRVMVHLPLSVRPDNFCVHPDGGQLFITGEGRDAVVVVYPYFIPEVAETVLAGSQPGAMAATKAHLFVTNPSAGAVTIMNILRRRVIAVATVGTSPGCVTTTPDGEYALVLNQTSGDMAVIRIAGLQPDRRKTAALFTMIPVGSRPVAAVVTGV